MKQHSRAEVGPSHVPVQSLLALDVLLEVPARQVLVEDDGWHPGGAGPEKQNLHQPRTRIFSSLGRRLV